MAQREAMQAQGASVAQLVTLTPADAAQLMASRVKMDESGKITGMTLVRQLTDSTYLRCDVPTPVVDDLMRQIRALPPAERLGFMNKWRANATDAMYQDYLHEHGADPTKKSFDYAPQPGRAPVQPADSFRTSIPVPQDQAGTVDTGFAAAFSKSRVLAHLDSMKAAPHQAEQAGSRSQLPKGAKGKGTEKEPYEIDLTGKAPAEGPRVKLTIPSSYAIAGDTVHIEYTLWPSQVKQILESGSAPDLDGMILQAITRYGSEHGRLSSGPKSSDFESAASNIGIRLGNGLLSHIIRTALDDPIKDAALREYLGLSAR